MRLDDPNIPTATTIVGLIVHGMQGGKTVKVPPSMLKGLKGDPGDPLTFDNLTPAQIAILQQPAADAMDLVNASIIEAENAAVNANSAAENANNAAQEAAEALNNWTKGW